MADGRFSIGELAQRHGLSTATLHYYDRLLRRVATSDAACSCIRDRPAQPACELDVELPWIDAWACSCGSSRGWLGCGCRSSRASGCMA